MPRIRYVDCKYCKQKIDLKTISDDDLWWHTEDDEVAHKDCIPEKDLEYWIDNSEMRMAVDMSEVKSQWKE